MDTGGTDEQVAAGDEPDENVDHYVEKIEAAAEETAASMTMWTMAGDFRDFVLDIVRTLPKTWAQMSEKEQAARAQSISAGCKTVIREGVALLETHERTVVECLFEEVGFKKKGIVAKLGLDYADPSTRHALVDAQGKEILIVVADAQQYMGERAPAKIDKQQPDLPLGPTPEAEARVDADLDKVLAAGDHSEKPAAFISNLSVERAEAEKDPHAAGRAAALRGFNETRDPFEPGSKKSQDWRGGHAEGIQAMGPAAAAATAAKRRRRPNGPGAVA